MESIWIPYGKMSGKYPGNVRETPGKCPGNVRNFFLEKMSGKHPGNTRETSGKCPGNTREMSGKHPGNVREMSVNHILWKITMNLSVLHSYETSVGAIHNLYFPQIEIFRQPFPLSSNPWVALWFVKNKKTWIHVFWNRMMNFELHWCILNYTDVFWITSMYFGWFIFWITIHSIFC